MLNQEQAERQHSDVTITGFRAQAAAVGLIQLIIELQSAGLLSVTAVERIRDAIIDDLMLSRPIHAEEKDFRDRLRTRFARMLEMSASGSAHR
jgi:hypothetical protein